MEDTEKARFVEELKAICNRCKTERGLARAIANFIARIDV